MKKRENNNNLMTQQKKLGLQNYDIRIINLGKFIYKKLPIKKGRLLDVGAGNGLMLNYFRKKGYKVEGMEILKELFIQMKKNKYLANIKIINGDITKKSGQNQFDVVLATDLIEHIEDDSLALKNLFSYIKPSGYLVITVPAHKFLFGKRDISLGHYRRYNKKDFDLLVKNFNCKLVYSSYWNLLGFFIYFLYEKILRKAVNENYRTINKKSSILKNIVELEFRLEQRLTSVLWGLTLVMIYQKGSHKDKPCN